MKNYKGIIIEESLHNSKIFDNLKVLSVKITDEENPVDRWKIYTVKVSEEEIESLTKSLKFGWYMHFWKDRKVIVIFKERRFEFDYDDKKAWKPVIEYGSSLGIPKEQLDFLID